MAGKAERRAAARADREAREAQAAQAAGRRRRLYMLGGAVVVAAAVVGIAIAISSGGGGSKSGGGSGGTITGAAEVEAELAGIPQSGNTLGQASAPVTITEFADLQCPVCQEFNQDTLSKLIPNEVKAGKVKLIFRNLRPPRTTRPPSGPSRPRRWRPAGRTGSGTTSSSSTATRGRRTRAT